MTVKEMRMDLNGLADDAEIRFVYNCGDHWRTFVAAKIKFITPQKIVYSDYHQMDRMANEDDEETKSIIALSATEL